MSHIPLLPKQHAPKLHSPRRGPQVVCALLAFAIVLFFTFPPFAAYSRFVGNATVVAGDPPPEAVLRIVDAAKNNKLVSKAIMHDLLTTVGYLVEKEMQPR